MQEKLLVIRKLNLKQLMTLKYYLMQKLQICQAKLQNNHRITLKRTLQRIFMTSKLMVIGSE